ncbi:MAG: DUF898 family protein [Hyphomicrobiaceae bacterium]|nr:DUF898 family protein [Hyphomicrobiaceae bacterium]MCC0023101.1 DUF898 family protein [Hyphomicrobiaceae bacterium]
MALSGDARNPIEPGRTAEVTFAGSGFSLAGLLIPGYLLMLPTLGVFRFWQLTAKRRYYWSRTFIDGDALEYTGNAVQLLIGFLLALVVFIPTAGIYFWIGTLDQDPQYAGYLIVAAVLYFLAGYAEYRARRFRFTRTLWRGLRFSQSGSAWAYAVRRLLWSIGVLATAGLAYPFMRIDLFRYAWNNTQYGDRSFRFTGKWHLLIGAVLPVALLFAVLSAAGVFVAIESGVDWNRPSNAELTIVAGAAFILLTLTFLFGRARVTSRLYSAVEIGNAGLSVRVSAARLVGQAILYAILLTVAGFLALLLIGIASKTIEARAAGLDHTDISAILSIGWWQLGALGLGYLAILGVLSLLGEAILALGFWKAVARGTRINNADDLLSVRRGKAEESAVIGEGLADALNVGAY